MKKKVLLITPIGFYLFDQFLAKELEILGYEVFVANEEYPKNFLGKILGTLRTQLSYNLTRKKIYKSFIKMFNRCFIIDD